MLIYSSSQRLMASPSRDKSPAARPGAPRVASFSHQPGDNDRDDGDALKPPKHAQTFHNGSPVPGKRDKSDASDAFETNDDNSDADEGVEITRASIELDVLPIELVTLTDR